MKICENCGKELYTDVNICPYCGGGITEKAESDVITADDLPAFVPDVMNFAGDVEAKQESFRENRVAIYRRNQLIAAKEKLLPNITAKPQNDFVRVHLPEREKSSVNTGAKTVYRVKPAAVPAAAPAPMKKRNRVNAYAAAMIIFAAGFAVFLMGVSFFDTIRKGQSDYVEKPSVSKIQETQETVPPEIDYDIPVSRHIEKDGFSAEVRSQKYVHGAYTYDYVFEFTNTSSLSVNNFPDILAGGEGAEKVTNMLVFYPSGAVKRFQWDGGSPYSGSPVVVYRNGKYDLSGTDDDNYEIKPGEKAIGCITYALL